MNHKNFKTINFEGEFIFEARTPLDEVYMHPVFENRINPVCHTIPGKISYTFKTYFRYMSPSIS